jgi:CheY-like chemotaxis protein
LRVFRTEQPKAHIRPQATVGLAPFPSFGRKLQLGIGDQRLVTKSQLIRNSHGTLDFSRISVLLIDDNHFIRTLVARVLRSFGVQALTDVADAAEAFRLLKFHRYDLIICDFLMEPLSGIDFVRLVRTAKDSRDQEVPIIVLTAHTEYENVIQARNAGATEVMAKPISPRSLLKHVVYVFDNPRKFIRAKNYIGPDRRRQFLEWDGAERRGSGQSSEPAAPVTPEGVEIDKRWGMSPAEIKDLLSVEAAPTGKSASGGGL